MGFPHNLYDSVIRIAQGTPIHCSIVQAVPKASLTLGGKNRKFDFERCVFGTFIPLSL